MDKASLCLIGTGQTRYHSSFPCPSYAYTRRGGKACNVAYYGCLGGNVKPHKDIRNLRLTVRQSIGEPRLVHGLARRDELRHQVNTVLEMVGLSPVGTAREFYAS